MLERVKSKDLLAASYLFISCTFPEGKAPSVALYCIVMLCNAVYRRLTSYTPAVSPLLATFGHLSMLKADM